MLVDDFALVRAMLSGFLSQKGFTDLFQASDGVEAFDIMSAEHKNGAAIDLVITDWNMPEMDGIELLKKIRGDERFKKIPVLMISADSEKPNIEIAKQLGVSAYLTKPFTNATVEAALVEIGFLKP